ncbi:MAG TPA: hypothetical protein VJQ82_08690 [Terriglobales bacterium]|nr:hypothetical protein [Terriglobales bacterium]
MAADTKAAPSCFVKKVIERHREPETETCVNFSFGLAQMVTKPPLVRLMSKTPCREMIF